MARTQLPGEIASRSPGSGPSPATRVHDIPVRTIGPPRSPRGSTTHYLYAGVCKDGALTGLMLGARCGRLFAITRPFTAHADHPMELFPSCSGSSYSTRRTHHPQALYCLYDKVLGPARPASRSKGTSVFFLPHRLLGASIEYKTRVENVDASIKRRPPQKEARFQDTVMLARPVWATEGARTDFIL